MKIKEFKDRDCVGYQDNPNIHDQIIVEINTDNSFVFYIDNKNESAKIILAKEHVKDLINFLIGE